MSDCVLTDMEREAVEDFALLARGRPGGLHGQTAKLAIISAVAREGIGAVAGTLHGRYMSMIAASPFGDDHVVDGRELVRLARSRGQAG